MDDVSERSTTRSIVLFHKVRSSPRFHCSCVSHWTNGFAICACLYPGPKAVGKSWSDASQRPAPILELPVCPHPSRILPLERKRLSLRNCSLENRHEPATE